MKKISKKPPHLTIIISTQKPTYHGDCCF
uniref:Uncharacterized protein n=1 Tax=Rhizophora mucronata TaxID=61149 RepID=A0A2P2QAG2_RHIMU